MIVRRNGCAQYYRLLRFMVKKRVFALNSTGEQETNKLRIIAWRQLPKINLSLLRSSWPPAGFTRFRNISLESKNTCNFTGQTVFRSTH